MAIKVGINENVQLKSAEINEKGSLVLVFTDGAELSQIDTDDLLNDKAGVKSGNSTNIFFWPVQAEQGGQPRDVDRTAKDFVALRDQLEHILEGYMTTDKVKLNPYDGLTLTKENINGELAKQSTLDRMYKNLTGQFLEKFSTIGGDLSKKFRLLLVRKSESSHYGIFRKSYIKDNPFFESMDVPKDASNVRFTPWEIKNGYNNPNPIAKAAAPATEQHETADDILGSR
jgi:hypothetical protein